MRKRDSSVTFQQLKCAVEVWKCGSINKAAERLYMNQPNISRLIKNLESEFHLTLFSRTSSGMQATKDGSLFLEQAEKLVQTSEQFVTSFKNGGDPTTVFRIALPRGSYLSKAFSNALNTYPGTPPSQITYEETNNENAINCVSSLGYDAGIIRFPIEFETTYKKLLTEKCLKFQEVLIFRPVVVMRKDHPLAGHEYVHLSELSDYTALIHGDNRCLSFSDAETDRLYRTKLYNNSISIFERGSQFDFLRDIPGTFMLISPLTPDILHAYGLAQVKLAESEIGLFEDLMIMRRDRRYTDFIQHFMHQVTEIEHKIMDEQECVKE